MRTPPTVTITGCTPRGAVAGTVKFICEMPTRPIGVPAKVTVAGKAAHGYGDGQAGTRQAGGGGAGGRACTGNQEGGGVAVAGHEGDRVLALPAGGRRNQRTIGRGKQAGAEGATVKGKLAT